MLSKDIKWIVSTFIDSSYGDVESDVSLKDFSYWKIGGNITAIFYPNSIESLVFLRKNLSRLKINHLLVGKTSNILFTSSDINGVFVCLSRFLTDCYIDNEAVNVWGGASVPWLAYKVGCNGLSGIEHIVGVPGTIGGLVYMNGGSLRKAIGTNVESVTVIDSLGNIKNLNNIDCKFSYRQSTFQERDDWIVYVNLKLGMNDSKLVKTEMLNILRTRRKKFPLRLPSCGSVFKSNAIAYEKVGPPGLIIEKLGLKGKFIGGARIAPEHGNFIVNHSGDASSSDVAKLIAEIQQQSNRVFGVDLETEAKYLDRNCKLHCLSDYINANGVNI
ncbi:UDP-N-acetylmuramate dehydrogenase [Colwellia sp. MB3u-55]|uniref:UDP-N-acetylmuramate dehydrogenase n=1 Tax=Colwellia sp. MB3u-55 TaxID=2759810 RepID=UPI0015F4FA00|nr:UDP-N-acetylmuramate dehydrogenase [Colwellia sp. MB3u-55]MBA6253753.1 UDP-N-acetylmuramate dehydrogenase [Colwellia sp. MB3u-55]